MKVSYFEYVSTCALSFYLHDDELGRPSVPTALVIVIPTDQEGQNACISKPCSCDQCHRRRGKHPPSLPVWYCPRAGVAEVTPRHM